jgi:RNA polymerase sigma-70 factor (ECF subfamily)
MSTHSSKTIEARAVFEILVREHADMLGAYLRTLVGSDSSFDDLFQETMLVAWRRLPDYDRSRPFAPWLRGIAQVLVLEHGRKKRARPITADPEVLAEIDRRFDMLARAGGDTFKEKAERVWQCVGRLPEAMREAIHLVYVRGVQIAAAAESLSIGREAFGKRVQRARQLIAECLGVGAGTGAELGVVGQTHGGESEQPGPAGR